MEIIFLFLFIFICWLLLVLIFSNFDINFSSSPITAKGARQLSGRTQKSNKRKDERMEYQEINTQVQSQATIGANFANILVRRKYAEKFKAKLKRRGFNVQVEDANPKNVCVRFHIEW